MFKIIYIKFLYQYREEQRLGGAGQSGPGRREEVELREHREASSAGARNV